MLKNKSLPGQVAHWSAVPLTRKAAGLLPSGHVLRWQVLSLVGAYGKQPIDVRLSLSLFPSPLHIKSVNIFLGED